MNSTCLHAPTARDACNPSRADAMPAWVGHRPVVLIVDDTPDNLAFLSHTLQANGYAVLVALSGEDALKRLARVTPDVVLLDAMMPGMDGFDTCSSLKQDARHEHLPVIFMTALTESEHVVRAFRVGGVDYVTKPVRPEEVCARIGAHVQRSRSQLYAQAALSIDARAALVVGADGAVHWQSPHAARLVAAYPDDDTEGSAKTGVSAFLPPLLRAWFVDWLARGSPADAVHEIVAGHVRRTASVTPALQPGEWMIILAEIDDHVHRNSLAARFALTAREAEVLLWVSRGKANRDIGDILGMAPRTVNKHLEHLFSKLHVETRAAATALAIKALDRA
ncbi:response regulator transcription factor [Paraburkholderia sp. Ac-20340]|nr:response regulator transcription factor [Paraburkholderia sp. Ac-20340]MBN3852257.1 response regulator transcription factor [Paraburkholderia sp. Ac-20340]